MQFEVLGPVRLIRDGAPVPVSDQRRRLLAVLLARANRAVSVATLAEALWDADLPGRPHKSLQMHIHRLRKALDDTERLTAQPGGYLLRIGPGELDAELFSEQHGEAREAMAAGRLDDAVREFRGALELWRGEPYADVDDVDRIGAEAVRLTEARLAAYEELYDAELARGAHREIVPELTERVAEYPLRERFAGQLMRALHRAGRHARALTTYRQLRRRLAEKLDLEPGTEIRRLYEEIRAEAPVAAERPADADSPAEQGSAPARTEPPPRQLPPVTAVFVGRRAELAELERVQADGASVIVASGPAGVGKTSLAVQYARSAVDRYPDGQLYVDLRGHAPSPALAPIDALSQLLLGLGADPRRIPVDAEAATAAYRSLLADRKVLVLLDNAESAGQVRPLLPASPGCVALVTSRDRMLGLVAREGAFRLNVDLLPQEEARELLVRLLGTDRAVAEPERITDLVEACAGLPLAVRIVAAQLADQRHRSLAEYVSDLRKSPLAQMEITGDEQAAVATAFDLSYQRLDDDARRMFRLLGSVPGPDFSVAAVAALSAMEPAAASRCLRRLAAAHLVDEHQPDRYRFHDLLREYAQARGQAEESPETRALALKRLMTWYYLSKEAASSTLRPLRPMQTLQDIPEGVPPPAIKDKADAISWSKGEHDNIAAAVAAAGDQLPLHWAWDLALAHGTVMSSLGYTAGAIAVFRKGADAARAAGDSQALAGSLTGLGSALHYVDIRRAAEVYADAVTHAENAGDQVLLGISLNNLGLVHQDLGNLEAADTHLTRALAVKRAEDGKWVESTLHNLAYLAELRGQFARAAAMYEEVIELIGNESDSLAARAAVNLAEVRAELGDLRDTFAVLDRAERHAVAFGGARTELSAKTLRVNVLTDIGRIEEALGQARVAVARADEAGDARYRALTRIALGRALLQANRPRHAFEQFEQAVAIARTTGEHQPHIGALLGAARAELRLGATSSAESAAREAYVLARGGLRAREAAALVVLSQIDLAAGREEDAVNRAKEALAIHQACGQYLAEARALDALGEALRKTGDTAIADEHVERARRMVAEFRRAGGTGAAAEREPGGG
ncbi:AfsR/SARP family transcriptional regulator [Phytoactinopolyspora halotolerans]|uniref:Tetratricopeptide repeat protein n=1 Tax=Phytoactinopolyspora halotolerans TaxID=1981512 RepID=A0A6L9SAT0_9ACTN|nr:BTAD domain-containing putative transcriptional regulator [Phytoactinopolyspora halotolerans]NEE01608.1 tetratricopeptide repeat protein [Phytoactinopolyspora halotolerans]